MKRLSVVIVTYNSEADIFDCLTSIYQYCDIPVDDLEVIVVDNNSDDVDGCFQKIRERFGQKVLLVKNEQNAGYGQGNNVGIRESSSPIIMIMNPDVRLYEPVFQKILDAFDQDKTLSMLGMQQMLSPNTQSTSSVFFCNQMNGFLWSLLTALCLRCKLFFPKYMTFSGSCFCLRKQMFEEIGLFDEHNFMYGEEDDIHYRMMQRFGPHFKYDTKLHYIHLIEQRLPTISYQRNVLKAQIYLNEKNGYPRSKTIKNALQFALMQLWREKFNRLFHRPAPLLSMWKSWIEEIKAMRSNL